MSDPLDFLNSDTTNSPGGVSTNASTTVKSTNKSLEPTVPCNCDYACDLKNGLHPPLRAKNVWGRAGWVFGEVIASAVDLSTAESKARVKAFFESWQFLLPCGQCRAHYTKNLEKRPITEDVLMDNKNLLQWIVDMHNYVNEANGQPLFTLDDAMFELNNWHKRKTSMYSDEEIKKMMNEGQIERVMGKIESVFQRYRYVIVVIVLFLILAMLFYFQRKKATNTTNSTTKK